MTEKLVVPDIGDFEDVEVIEILVKEGDQIKVSDPVVTIESDKSSVEIPSTISGKVENIAVKVGDKVSKDDLLLNISSSGKILDDKSIPKDTESIIKQGRSRNGTKKRGNYNFSRTSSKKRAVNYSSN
jgi:pyruvate dehydrogenase E1 component